MPSASRLIAWKLLGAAVPIGAVAAAALVACATQLAGQPVCSGAQVCGAGEACVLGRCRPVAEVPASRDATRLVFDALEWAHVRAGAPASRGTALERPASPIVLEAGDGGAPDDASGTDASEPDADARAFDEETVAGDEAIVLGRKGDGPSVLLMRFALDIPPERELELALLVLDPLPSCPRYAGRVDLELAQVLEPWHAESVSFGRQPSLDLPVRAPSVQTATQVPLRLDVTPFVAAWRENRSRYHGLALVSAGTSASGACYSAGVSSGRGPHIDVYLRAPPKEPALDAGDDADADADVDADADDPGDTSDDLETEEP